MATPRASVLWAILAAVGCWALIIQIASSQPNITGVSQSNIQHKQTLIITGSGFGVKQPAVPFFWHDCEDKTVDSNSALTDVYDKVLSQCVAPARRGFAWPRRARRDRTSFGEEE